MPVTLKKMDGYRVSTPSGVKSKGTTLEKAKSQERLLNAVEHGWHPTGKPAKTGNALRNAVMGSSNAVVNVARAKNKKGK